MQLIVVEQEKDTGHCRAVLAQETFRASLMADERTEGMIVCEPVDWFARVTQSKQDVG